VRILIVEDDPRLARLVQRGLTEAGHAVDYARDGETALVRLDDTAYDAVLLDVMLPGRDGFDTCRELRRRGAWAPVLMLTARDSVEDRVRGLDCGADDYVVKPFSFAELAARLRALARRATTARPTLITVGDLVLDPAALAVAVSGVLVELSAKEFAVLEALMRRPGQVLSRGQLLEHAWDHGYEERSNVIDVYIRYLREKIDRPFGRESIETVRGVGYRLRNRD